MVSNQPKALLRDWIRTTGDGSDVVLAPTLLNLTPGLMLKKSLECVGPSEWRSIMLRIVQSPQCPAFDMGYHIMYQRVWLSYHLEFRLQLVKEVPDHVEPCCTLPQMIPVLGVSAAHAIKRCIAIDLK